MRGSSPWGEKRPRCGYSPTTRPRLSHMARRMALRSCAAFPERPRPDWRAPPGRAAAAERMLRPIQPPRREAVSRPRSRKKRHEGEEDRRFRAIAQLLLAQARVCRRVWLIVCGASAWAAALSSNPSRAPASSNRAATLSRRMPSRSADGQAHEILFGGDQLGLAGNGLELEDFFFRIRMMIGEETAAGDLGAAVFQRGDEFLRPPDAGKGEDRSCRRRPRHPP